MAAFRTNLKTVLDAGIFPFGAENYLVKWLVVEFSPNYVMANQMLKMLILPYTV